MRVNPINNIKVAQVMENPITTRLNEVRNGLRAYGAVVLQDNPIDNAVIERLKKQFGNENVTVEKSKSIKVSVDNFRR